MEQQKTETRSITAEQRKRVEEVCFRSLALIRRNCEYLEQHFDRTGADTSTRQAVADIDTAAMQLDCGVQVSIRTNDLYGSQYQCKLPFRTQLPNEIAGAGFHLLMERYRWDKPIRAVTIRGIDLISQKDAEQLSMFVNHQKRDRRILLEDAVEDIRRRFGKRAISYAILMGDLKIPDDGRQLVTMSGLMYQ